MKIFKSFLVLFILGISTNFSISQNMPDGRELLKIQECDKLNETIRNPSNIALSEWILSMEGTGFIKFNMEKMQNEGGIDSIENLLGMSSPNSFVITDEEVSPINPDITFITTQQFYNGVYVEGGGYILGLIDCVTFFMNAYIMEGIDISLSPPLTKQQAISALQGYEVSGVDFVSTNPEDDIELVIDRDLSTSCDYVLAWKIKYLKGVSSKTAFVNASDGSVYKESARLRNINAPTPAYGTVNMDDDLNFPGTRYYLRNPSNSVVTFDKTGQSQDGFYATTSSDAYAFSFEEFIPSTLDEWPTEDASDGSYEGHDPKVYQCHYVTTNASDILGAFGMSFPRIHVAANVGFSNAGYTTITSTNAPPRDVIFYGKLKEKFTGLIDVAGHELTHVDIGGKFVNSGESFGIEEAICDIFGEYTENVFDESDDWMVGGDNGLNLRDMSNPKFPNYFPEIGEEDEHLANGPMGRWFSILVDGGTFLYQGNNYTINGLDIAAAAQIVYGSIGFMNSASDYVDARAATIAMAEQIYGECSDEAEAVAIAWYAVGLGYPDHCRLLVNGSIEYCEEDLYTPAGDVEFTLVNPIPGYTYRWSYPYDWHAIGESAPQTFIGTHLRIYDYGFMPFFPRYYTITVKEYDQSNVFQKYKSITVKIKDCDGDDPENPCEEDDEMDFLIVNENQNGALNNVQLLENKDKVVSFDRNELRFLSAMEAESNYKYSFYDISGKMIRTGRLGDGFNLDGLPHSGIYVFHVYDQSRRLVQAEKICHVK